MRVGYARVSSSGQNLTAQLESLSDCKKIFSEKKSGTTANDRTQLNNCLDFIRDGDTLVITRLDRLARSVFDLQMITKKLNDKNVALVATEQSIDTSTAQGKLMFGMLSVIAEFETDLRKERQMEGIQSALARGVKFGTKKLLTDEKIIEAIDLRDIGFTGQEVADKLEVSRSTLYKSMKDYKMSV